MLIAGGSGLIGQNLNAYMVKLNYNVKILSRNKESKYYWNPKKNELDTSILTDVDYVINLCGGQIDKRWTKRTRKETQPRQPNGGLARDNLGVQSK